MTRKELLKHYRVTEKQVELLQLVAKHPLFGATVPTMGRILPGALRSGLVEKVWLDKVPPIVRTVTDTIPGAVLKTTSNQWYELSDSAVRCMEALFPGWTYERPSARWPT
jgi:hypothetical protein